MRDPGHTRAQLPSRVTVGTTGIALVGLAVVGWAAMRLSTVDGADPRAWAGVFVGTAVVLGTAAAVAVTRHARTLSLAVARRTLAALARTTHDWMWSTDGRGRFAYSNDAISDLLGYRSEEIIGRAASDLFDAEYLSSWLPELRGIRESVRGWYDVTQRMRHRDGSVIVVESSAQPIVDRRGRVVGFEGSVRPISADRKLADRLAEQRTRVERVLADRALRIAFQPIVNLATGAVAGVEALARFTAEPYQPPEAWFGQAAEVGLGVNLELLALRTALDAVPQLPEDLYVSINASPRTVSDPSFLELLLAPGTPLTRLVLEITEHESIEDYQPLANTLGYARSLGLRLAVDDAGSGYASFRHILKLRPDHIKLDRDLTAGIDRDPARRALASAVVVFALELDASVTAEGVETEAELDTLRSLSVDAAQGYYLARPATDPAEWSRWPSRSLRVLLVGRAVGTA